MQAGYDLDYVYHQDGMGGYPLLYARPADQEPYTTEADYLAAAADQQEYLAFVLPQDNPEGYFEYAAFAMVANQFYLDWHANYNDAVLCAKRMRKSSSEKDAFTSDDRRPKTRGAGSWTPPSVARDRGGQMLVFTWRIAG
jgi:hypothetical protein